MHCTHCGYPTNRVVDTNQNEKTNTISRRRECLRCGFRFTTQEQLRPPKEKKSNET